MEQSIERQDGRDVREAIDFLSSLGYTVIPPQEMFAGLIGEPAFEEWWNLYDKKRGRKKTEEKWKRLKPQQRIACMNATKAYVESTPDKQYRADPLTYLNGERWNDEIINNITHGTDRRTYEAQQRAADATAGGRRSRSRCRTPRRGRCKGNPH